MLSKGKTKAILRQEMTGLVPNSIVSRKDKMGVVTPEDIWLREHIKSLKKNLFKQLPPFIDEARYRA